MLNPPRLQKTTVPKFIINGVSIVLFQVNIVPQEILPRLISVFKLYKKVLDELERNALAKVRSQIFGHQYYSDCAVRVLNIGLWPSGLLTMGLTPQ